MQHLTPQLRSTGSAPVKRFEHFQALVTRISSVDKSHNHEFLEDTENISLHILKFCILNAKGILKITAGRLAGSTCEQYLAFYALELL